LFVHVDVVPIPLHEILSLRFFIFLAYAVVVPVYLLPLRIYGKNNPLNIKRVIIFCAIDTLLEWYSNNFKTKVMFQRLPVTCLNAPVKFIPGKSHVIFMQPGGTYNEVSRGEHTKLAVIF
jgi:hypothetical protein